MPTEHVYERIRTEYPDKAQFRAFAAYETFFDGLCTAEALRLVGIQGRQFVVE